MARSCQNGTCLRIGQLPQESGTLARMSDLAVSGGPAHPLAALPRVWWFSWLPGYRPGARATYAGYELDDQPPTPADEGLRWLENEAGKPEWSIADGDPVRALTSAGLEAVASGLPVPASLRLLAARGDLQRRIRSATACYLDLGDLRLRHLPGAVTWFMCSQISSGAGIGCCTWTSPVTKLYSPRRNRSALTYPTTNRPRRVSFPSAATRRT